MFQLILPPLKRKYFLLISPQFSPFYLRPFSKVKETLQTFPEDVKIPEPHVQPAGIGNEERSRPELVCSTFF